MSQDEGWIPPATPLVGTLLEAERRRLPPSPRQRRRLWRRTRRTLGASGLLAPAALAANLSGTAVIVKGVAVGSLAVLAVTMGVGLIRPVSRPGPAPASITTPIATPATAAPLPHTPLSDPGAAPPRVVGPGPGGPQAPALDSPASPASPTPGTPPTRSPRLARLDDRFRAEAALIDRARRQLEQGNVPAAAGALVRHTRLFPQGIFREEREALQVLCLAHQRQAGEACAAAARFRTRYPRSLFLEVVNRAAGRR